MFAVFKTGGKQYRVIADDVLEVAKVKGEPGEIVEFGEVLVVGGDSLTLGAPTVPAEDHRLQKTPAQEFAPQDRTSPGIHASAHHRNFDRW